MNSAVPAVRDREVMICQQEIDRLFEELGEIKGVLVSSIDGFEVAARMRGNSSPAKLAAMTSSLLALGEAVTEEGEVGQCIDLLIDATAGRVLLMDIPHPTRKLLLTVLSNNSSTLGGVIWAARNCRQLISEKLLA